MGLHAVTELTELKKSKSTKELGQVLQNDCHKLFLKSSFLKAPRKSLPYRGGRVCASQESQELCCQGALVLGEGPDK